MEIWKDIKGYEGLYQVSNLGNVRSLPHFTEVTCNGSTHKSLRQGRMLKPTSRQHGYLAVQLYGRGGHATRNLRTVSIHRLVAEAFLDNPNGYEEVNHINEIKTDNRVENLEWCNHKQNSNAGTRPERIGNANRNGKKSRPINQYTLEGEYIQTFPSMAEASRHGFSQGNIFRCIKGDYSHAYGYLWRYAT